MPKDIPWIKEYLSTEMTEIAMLPLAERGAYYSLKLIYHTNPEAFNNMQILFAMCLAFSEDERTAVQTTVERLFKQSNKYPFNERLDKLEKEAVKGIKQKSLAGKISGEKRRAKRTAVQTILESESEIDLDKKNQNLKSEKKIFDSDSKNKFKNRFDWKIEENIQHETHLQAQAEAKIYGENLQTLFDKFNGFIQFKPDNPDLAFLAWIKRYCNQKQQNKATETLAKSTSPPLKTHLEAQKNGFDFLKWNGIHLSLKGSISVDKNQQEYYEKHKIEGLNHKQMLNKKG